MSDGNRGGERRKMGRRDWMWTVFAMATIASGLFGFISIVVLGALVTLALIGVVFWEVASGRNRPSGADEAGVARSPWDRIPAWLVVLVAGVGLYAASRVHVPGRPISSTAAFAGAMAGCALLLVLLVWMILHTVLPGRKVRARIIRKETTDTQPSDGSSPVQVRYVTVASGGAELRLQVDLWDYNHVSVGDEGTLEYKKNELRSFTKLPADT